MMSQIRQTLKDFSLDFVRNPYLYYTEHGQHALVYSMLYNVFSEEQRYITWRDKKVCVIQKEYPTAGKLGKPQRQHWDIAVLKSPPESIIEGAGSYDYLKLFAVIEFGMNEAKEHLEDDISRLCHPKANLEHAFIVHLYRLSESGNLFSSRDWSSKSKQIVELDEVRSLSSQFPVEIYYGRVGSIDPSDDGAWVVRDGTAQSL